LTTASLLLISLGSEEGFTAMCFKFGFTAIGFEQGFTAIGFD
jgi:hypothetical protein